MSRAITTALPMRKSVGPIRAPTSKTTVWPVISETPKLPWKRPASQRR